MDGAMDDFAPTPKKKRSGLIIAIIVLLILGGGAYYFFNQGGQDSEDQISPTVTAAPTEEPTPTEEASPSGSLTPTGETSATPRPTTGEVESATELNIQVLNGSGTVGAAGEARDHLTSQGYDNIDTDNADNFDYTGVTINIKASRQDFLSDIQDALKDKYTISDTGTLSASSTYDVVVIVGK